MKIDKVCTLETIFPICSHFYNMFCPSQERGVIKEERGKSKGRRMGGKVEMSGGKKGRERK